VLTHAFSCTIFVPTHFVKTHNMGEVLKNRLKSTKDIPLREEVDLNIKVASSLLEHQFSEIAEKYGITASQYNVLRILKGVFPNGHARCDIASRMIDRSPDITRLIDRLEKQGLVERDRTDKDRRMSITRITKRGIKLADEIKPIVEKAHKTTTKSLSDDECRELSRLLEKYYKDLV